MEENEVPAIVRLPDGTTALIYSCCTLRLEDDGSMTLLDPDGRIDLTRLANSP